MLSKKAILCVDDETNILTSLTRLLRKEEYDVITASSGTQGLLELEKRPVQLVISDQRMPEMTGTEFLQKVKDRYPDTVRVILSGFADFGVIIEAINRGEVYRFLTKPWNDEELKVTLRQCLERYDFLMEKRNLNERIQIQNDELQLSQQKLEVMVSERTWSLSLSQQLLDNLPFPVIGISEEEMIVYANRSVGESSPVLSKISLGINIQLCFPTPLVEDVKRCLAGSPFEDWTKVQIGVEEFRCRMQALRKGESIIGCVLVLSEV